jgi:ferredoxin
MKIDAKKCVGCGGCVNLCAVDAISFFDDRAVINEEVCTDCGSCLQVCGVEAPQQ